MNQSFDTDSLLFRLMNDALKSAISGGVYIMKRPTSSTKEDVVVNTITISQEYYPQIAACNVNIHVPDMVVTIGGVQQTMPNIARLKVLSEMAVNALRLAKIDGTALSVEFQKIIEEEDIKQSYTNIRITLTIHT